MFLRRFALSATVMLGALTIGGPAALAVSTAPPVTSTVETQELRRLGPLTDLVIQRLLVGDLVAASKFGTGKPIDDPVREQQVLDGVRAQAGPLGLDPEATVRFFRDQITANKIVQRGLFDHWTRHPDQAPTTRPDLNLIRQRLDELATRMLAELVSTKDIRKPGIGCQVRLLVAQHVGAAQHRLDRLHRQALDTGVGSIC
ncbi:MULTISPECIES: chorismate mutase [unclassified Crossiella]|uniref:chorismate mutase n=1 Tax=unclassified Crossiella TaxID=2620835 RepID=UPI001FFFB91D|nr:MULTISPECIES: chorismate mutase [unclassified Crossiella]MCK2243505.1 chorismate mutase [Crossiella sp. S99.2]MCK2257363.1 chorismate mutase [Crossiella sp. S99.1]